MIAVREIDCGKAHEVKCYQNGRSLSDDDTVEALRAKIADPYAEISKKRRIITSVVTYVLCASAVILLFGWHSTWKERVVAFFGMIALAFLLELTREGRMRRARRRFLRLLDGETK